MTFLILLLSVLIIAQSAIAIDSIKEMNSNKKFSWVMCSCGIVGTLYALGMLLFKMSPAGRAVSMGSGMGARMPMGRMMKMVGR